MKQFFKNTFSSMLGFIFGFGFLIVLIIGIGFVVGSGFQNEDKLVLKDKSYLQLNLNGGIVDQGSKQELDIPMFMTPSGLGLNQILKSIKDAKEDSLISGIYLNCGMLGAGMATTEEIRTALQDFKSSGKWIVSYAEIMSQKGYYLASVADEIYMFPKGGMEWKGLGSRMAFFKGFFDKTGIEMQVIRGSNNKFKSAVEPFLAEEISDANREQVESYQRALWMQMLKGVSDDRGVALTDLDALADTLGIRSPEDAVNHRLIDQLAYEDEVIEILRAKMQLKDGEKLPKVKMKAYVNRQKKADVEDLKKDQIAVLFAQGEIHSGSSSDNNSIGSESLIKEIRKLQKKDKIKAVVLRINSPGGSALASEAIWRELELLNATKPLVVSMGNVAASGGYYIACGADHIFAQPNTITGSIGVFGTIPNIGDFMQKHFGVKYSEVQTNSHATMGSITKALTEEEYLIIQSEVDRIYDVFTQRVADGRSKEVTEVDEIGQGRVWAGIDALNLGLVDELGGLREAILKAKELAKLEGFKVVEFPKVKEPLQQFLDEIKGAQEEDVLAKVFANQKEIQEMLRIKKMTEQSEIRAELPYMVNY